MSTTREEEGSTAGPASPEERLRRLEDIAEIQQLVVLYTLAVDGMDWDTAADLWADDGTFELTGHDRTYHGPAGVREMLETEAHSAVIASAGAHVSSLPYLIIDGDRAVATNYARLYLREEDGHSVFRVTLCRWELARVRGQWKITRRINEVFTTSGAAFRLAGQARSFSPEEAR